MIWELVPPWLALPWKYNIVDHFVFRRSFLFNAFEFFRMRSILGGLGHVGAKHDDTTM